MVNCVFKDEGVQDGFMRHVRKKGIHLIPKAKGKEGGCFLRKTQLIINIFSLNWNGFAIHSDWRLNCVVLVIE